MGRSRAKDHDEKRLAILKNAAAFFAAKGYDAASIRDLADHCNISKALIYHYYSSKEALLFGIIKQHLDRLLHEMETAETIQDPEQDLLHLINIILEVYRNADSEHKLQLNASERLPLRDQNEIKDMQRRVVAIMAKKIDALAPDQFAKAPHTLKPVTMSVFGMLNWFYMWYSDDQSERKQTISRRDYAKMVHDFVLGGIDRAT